MREGELNSVRNATRGCSVAAMNVEAVASNISVQKNDKRVCFALIAILDHLCTSISYNTIYIPNHFSKGIIGHPSGEFIENKLRPTK